MAKTFIQQITSDIKFALDNGFTNIEVETLRGGQTSFSGSFGYVEVTEEEAAEIFSLLGKYAPITINGVTTLEVYNEHSGLKVGDIVTTGKRMKKVTAIKLMQTIRNEGKPELWFYMESTKSGANDVVGLATVKKYKIVNG